MLKRPLVILAVIVMIVAMSASTAFGEGDGGNYGLIDPTPTAVPAPDYSPGPPGCKCGVR